MTKIRKCWVAPRCVSFEKENVERVPCPKDPASRVAQYPPCYGRGRVFRGAQGLSGCSQRIVLFFAVELAQHFVVASTPLFGCRPSRVTKHLVHLHATAPISSEGGIWRWRSSIFCRRPMMGRVETMRRLWCQALWRRGIALGRWITVWVASWLLLGVRLVTHGRRGRRGRRPGSWIGIIIAATAVGARLIRAVSRARVGVGRLGRMSVLVVRVIIRRGALVTDSIIILGGLSLPLSVIRRSSRRV